MVQVTVCGGGQLEGPEADVIQGFIVNAEGFVCVLYLQMQTIHVKVKLTNTGSTWIKNIRQDKLTSWWTERVAL